MIWVSQSSACLSVLIFIEEGVRLTNIPYNATLQQMIDLLC